MIDNKRSCRETGFPTKNPGQSPCEREKEAARKKAPLLPENLERLSPVELRALAHELQVHQIELEIQNEKLCRSKIELEELRERYFKLYDLAPSGYLTISESGVILEANITAAVLLDVARNSLIKKPISAFIFSEDQDIYSRRRKELFETGASQVCEIRMAGKDDAFFWARIDSSMDCGDTGEPVCRAALVDITGLKQAEDALAGTESKYRTLFENITDGVLVANITSKQFLFASSSICKMLGYSHEELLSMGVENIHPEDALPYVLSQFEKQGRGELKVAEDLPCLRKDGSVFFADVSAGTLEIGGQLLSMGIFRDITERKQVAEELRESEEKHRILFESSQDAIMILEPPTWNFTKGNPATINMFAAKDEKEFISLSPASLSPEKQPDGRLSGEKAMEMIESAMRDGVKYFEWTHKRFNGEEFPVTVLLTRVQQKEKTFLQATVRDITNLKKSEEEKEMLEQQLIQAQKMESIGMLAGGIAHDFNNILTIVMGNANLMQLSLKPEDKWYRESMNIMGAAERAEALTSKLLTFSRREKLNVTYIGMEQLVNRFASILERSIDKKIQIRTKTSPGIIVKGDQNQLEQALMNVCVNARDAIAEGGTLTIECEEIEIDEAYCHGNAKARIGRFCMIQVSDTGTGIDGEILHQIMDPFFTTKGPGKGTGLGLSVTHGIIANHNGFMDIYSEAGMGTTVKVYLPIAADRAVQNQPATEKEIRRGTETILVVDDEEQVLRLSERVLKSMGYKVYKAPGGTEAIKIYREHMDEIALVLLDMVMPEMDGTEVFNNLKELNPGARIVILSGYSADGKAGRLMKEGARAFVSKPFRIPILSEVVRMALDE